MEEKVLLVSLRSPFLDNDKVYPALANLYLQSALQAQGIESRLTDNWASERIVPYSHIGVSIMTPQRDLAKNFINYVKRKYPEVKVIAGGPHAKFYTNELAKEPWDNIVTDDGERVLPRIIRGEITDRIVTDKMTTRELAQMPRPNRLGNRDYLKEYVYMLEGKRSGTMITARGCPEQCTFCEDAMTTTRRTSLNKLVLEMDDLKELGYEGVYLFDDIFAMSLKQAEPIARELQRRKLIYRCNGQARMMNEDIMRMLSETGCREIAFGAESGSQKILDNIRKRTNTQQNYRFCDWARKFNIPVKLFILLGLPGEDRGTLKDTEQFIAHSGASDVQVAVYYPYKGTQIRDAIEQKQSIDINFNGEGLGAYGQKGGESEYVVGTKELTAQDLHEFRDELIRKYRPPAHSKHKEMQRKEEDDFYMQFKEIPK